ncbi:class I SAM-dependent DNA methyltransferase [Celeribacter sp.]|uniref:class I SAM-dependent DNA methyltransferase n=1 Tax=Celeribacter sp. TaxID=1890673 RepID=UPI003A951FF2
MDVEEFIARWAGSGGSEMATAQSFAIELTELLGVERPYVSDKDGDFLDYRFERPVTLTHTGRKRHGRIDLYKKGHFILEAKQFVSASTKDQSTLEMFLEKDTPKQTGHGKRHSAKFDDTMLKARNQADNYARAVAKEDGWPPFLMVVDVGHVIELYADFSKQGQGYNQFPDGNRYRIYLEDLRQEETRALLRTIWTDPYSLDPARHSAKVTREIAKHLAELGKSFEGQGHDSETVARFLMRCLFSMFAEDVDLIPYGSFTAKLEELQGHPEHAQPTLKSLWETMNTGGFSPVLTKDLKRFNGGLFKDADALPLGSEQLEILIKAAKADWKQVEPAIFGTLLERALDAKQRHKLGAHYTPRAYVERLVMPTIMEPLREDWRHVQLSVQRLTSDGKNDEALKIVRDFHSHLCDIRVLDPACGSGNFLYVALEMMKRLEGEVTALMEELGETQTSFITVDPHQFLGIELNPWAANVAELVLWIGYLQWHFRTHGTASPSEPVLRDFKNIKNADAVLDWEDRTPRMDENGNPVTRWDGVTTMRHPITGEEVPDPDARIQVYDYTKPKATKWPEATFIVGNPPFIGLRNIRKAYSDGYLEALRSAYPKVPDNADYVMYWWDKAALAVRAYDAKKGKGTRRFGLITTNSIKQSFNRAVTARHMGDAKFPFSLIYAIPDHPWVDSADGAAVRIAMSVGARGQRDGRLHKVISESQGLSEGEGALCEFEAQLGMIHPDFRLGANLLSAKLLKSNSKLSSVGYQLTGKGFLLDPEEMKLLCEREPEAKNIIRPWTNGLGIQRKTSPLFAVDAGQMEEAQLKACFPNLYQHLHDNVRPERAVNSVPALAENWWKYARPRNEFRPAIANIDRMIVTSLTASNRIFVFTSSDTIADSTTVMFALDGGEHLAVMSSSFHLVWVSAAGGTLEDRPRYNKSRCFDPFPFPDLTDAQKVRLAKLGDELDAHRKRQQTAHPKLTLTLMYNVLEKLRAGEVIEGKDKEIYDQGLIGILKDLHDQIDAAVAEAYGWPADLSDEEILFNLVALNKERAEEEARGHIRWLRPEYQNPTGAAAAKGETKEMALGTVVEVEKAPWPKSMPEQFAAIQEVLADMGEATPEQIARKFKRARTTSVQPLLESLVVMGQAEQVEGGKYAA